MKYKQWLTDWLKLYVKPVVKERTYEKYKRTVAKTVIPAMGEMEIVKITAIHLQRFVVSLSGNGLAPSSVNGIISVIKSSLKTAMLAGVVRINVAVGIQRPKFAEKKTECFTFREQKLIEEYILRSKNVKLYGIILALYSGLRLGELLSLKWSDVDLKKKILTVSATCQDSWVNGKYVKVFTSPKTETSNRTIPIPKSLIALLKEMKAKSSGEFVVSGRTQYGVGVRSYQRAFETLLGNLSIPRKGFHALRHTFATRALERGMDVKTLSEILGHKNTSVTLNRYVHSLDEHKVNMMNRLGKLLQ